MAAYNFNLRGTRVYPISKESVHYYLCVIDAPSGVQQSDFTIDKSAIDTLKFTYAGDFSSWGTATQTVCLPLYTYNPIHNDPPEKKIMITDTSSSKNTTSGDPAKGRPPKVPMQPTANSNYLADSQVFQSATQGFSSNYFVVTMVSTKIPVSPGGYANFFKSFKPSGSQGALTVQFQMDALNGNKPVVIGGAVPSSLGYYVSAQAIDKNGTAHPAGAIDWTDIQPI